MLKVRFKKWTLHRKYKYPEGTELVLSDDEALALEKSGSVEIIQRGPGRPRKATTEDEEFVSYVKPTGRKASWGKKKS